MFTLRPDFIRAEASEPAGQVRSLFLILRILSRRIVKLPETRKRFENDALVTMDVDAAALTSVIAKEAATWGALAKDIGLRVQ